MIELFLRPVFRGDKSLRGFASVLTGHFFPAKYEARAKTFVQKLLAKIGNPTTLEEAQAAYKEHRRQVAIAHHKKYCPGESLPPELEDKCPPQ
jgi:hypothetical protein